MGAVHKEEALYCVLQLLGEERGEGLISADLQTIFLGIQGHSEYAAQLSLSF